MLSSFVIHVPPPVQFVVFMLFGAGYALLISWLGYGWFIRMAQDPDAANATTSPGADQADPARPAKPKIPGPFDLQSRVLTFISLAFVFLLAFSLNTFWGNIQAANSAVFDEGAAAGRVTMAASLLAAPEEATALQQAVIDYSTTVVDTEWPVMREGDVVSASAIQMQASKDLATAAREAASTGVASDPLWPEVTSAINDLGTYAADRLAEVPDATAPWRMLIVIILGFAFVTMTAAYLPTRVRMYRIAMAIIGALSALLIFIMVQASNPYAQFISPDALTLVAESTTTPGTAP